MGKVEQVGRFELEFVLNKDIGVDKLSEALKEGLPKLNRYASVTLESVIDETDQVELGWVYNAEFNIIADATISGRYSPATQWDPAEYPDMECYDQWEALDEIKMSIIECLHNSEDPELKDIDIVDTDILSYDLDDEDTLFEKYAYENKPDLDNDAYDRWKDAQYDKAYEDTYEPEWGDDD